MRFMGIYVSTISLLFDIHVLGRGECICGSQQLCGCTCQCNVAPQSGLSYMERDCSCDPDNCFNEEYPDVSVMIVCRT